MARLATDVRTDAPVDEGKAAVMGGVVTGALTGLAADLATGGLTFGAGMLTGALLGALGGAGVARGINVVRGRTEATVRWDDAFLDGLVDRRAAALPRGRALRPRPRRLAGKRIPAVLARARGSGRRVAASRHWPAIWALRTPDGDAAHIEARLRETLREIAATLLEQLYPGAFHIRRAREPGASDAR